MTARPRLVLIGLAAVWTAGVWASPVMPLPPLAAVPQDPGAEAAPSNASAPSPRFGSGAERPSLLPAPRIEGTEAAGQTATEAAPLLPSPPLSMTTQATGPDAPASPPSAGRETGEPGLFPARRSGATETAGRPAPQPASLPPASPTSVETRSAGTDGRAQPSPAQSRTAADAAPGVRAAARPFRPGSRRRRPPPGRLRLPARCAHGPARRGGCAPG